MKMKTNICFQIKVGKSFDLNQMILQYNRLSVDLKYF